jgi:DNA-binding transcriptional ArsR family regulator
MALGRADLILHPVRMRLVAALARRPLTARQLSEVLPDVPQATLYHHLGLLTRSGLLRVVSERQVRGTIEKAYAVADDYAIVGADDLANVSREDHLRYFTVFVTMLLADFARYLQQGGPIDLAADGVGYREVPFYMSDAEFAEAAAAINQALRPYMNNQPSPSRRRRLLATIVMPDVELPESLEDGGPSTSTED